MRAAQAIGMSLSKCTCTIGEKLNESNASDVRELCTTLLNCYLIQLLETGFLHADPHPGNLIRTPDGRICILDFGLMTEVSHASVAQQNSCMLIFRPMTEITAACVALLFSTQKLLCPPLACCPPAFWLLAAQKGLALFAKELGLLQLFDCGLHLDITLSVQAVDSALHVTIKHACVACENWAWFRQERCL